MSDVLNIPPLPRRPFYFLRHGQTDWNVEGRLQGSTDTPLNATGLEQAMAAAVALKPAGIARIFSSPLQRAKATADVVALTLGTPLVAHPDLKEQSFGSWEGQLITDIAAQYALGPTDSFAHLLPPDSEPFETTRVRMTACVAEALNAHPNETLLFVSHLAAFRALHEALCGPSPLPHNACPIRFTPTPTGWTTEVLETI